MTPRPGFDPASLVAGLIVIALGVVLLLDHTGVLDLRFDYWRRSRWPRVGGILLACGLAGPPRDDGEQHQQRVRRPRRSPRRSAATAPARSLGGVCAGLAPRLGVDPLVLRVGFVLASVAGGVGIGALRRSAGRCCPPTRASGRAGGSAARSAARESWQVAAGIVLLRARVLLLFRAWGIWFSDAVVWPLVLRGRRRRADLAPVPARGGRRRRRRASRPSPAAARAAAARPAAARARRSALVGLGAALVVGAALVFLWLNGALVAARDVMLAVFVVVVALTLILAPWWLRLVRGLTEERAERIRTQERAEVAAHLHDSVLQTLALMQKRAGEPREVAALARRQERELRAWLNGERARARARRSPPRSRPPWPRWRTPTACPSRSSPSATARSTRRGEALVAAAREAVLNAVKFAPGARDQRLRRGARATASRCSCATAGRASTPPPCPADRRGLRESVLGRMERHGGRAEIHTRPGAGTEVELVMGR